VPVVRYGCLTSSLTLRDEYRLRVFENNLLRRIFGMKRDKVIGRCRKLHNKEFCNLYSSPHIFKMIMSRKIRWKGRVAHMGRRRTPTGCWWEGQKKSDHSGHQGINGRIILK
jgi:hypothetical protein